jgi:translation initiation factor 3 subunit G
MASNAWGDAVDDEKYLPPSTVSGPDKNGIKTYTEYKFNNKKQKIKVIRRVKVQTKSRKVSRLIAERKQWLHFGAAKGKPQGEIDTDVTLHSHEDVHIDSPFTKQKDASEVLLEKLEEMKIKRAVGGGLRRGPRAADLEDDTEEIGKGRYTVPGRRGGAGEKMSAGEAMRGGRDESATLRVTNLSEETREADLRDLFSHYGRVTRVYLALDRETQKSRGFAFVSFYSKDDAANAMENLQGYGYDHLILKIDWAEPNKKDDNGGGNAMKYASGYGKALPQMSVKSALGGK